MVACPACPDSSPERIPSPRLVPSQMQSGINGSMEIQPMSPAALKYTAAIYDSIAASRKIRGKPMPTFLDWLDEVDDLAAIAKATALGVRP